MGNGVGLKPAARLVVSAAVGLLVVLGCGRDEPPSEVEPSTRGVSCPAADAGQPTRSPATNAADQPAEQFDSLGANAGCYVCHMTFVQEELAKTHLAARIGCVNCYGSSTGHANDGNIGATPPDIVIKRDQINASCRACHATHDVPPEKVIARWQDRCKAKPATQPSALPAVCTDCHGNHKISAG